MPAWRAIPSSAGKPLARALLALGLLLLVGCGADPREDGVLRFGLSGPPRSLDPRFAADATSERVNRLLYRRLVEFDDRGLPIPGIARWTAMTPTLYRFELGEQGRDFSDGTQLSAADVVATYDYVLDPANASPHRAQLGMIASVAALGPDTIEFRLSTPDPLFPAYLGEGILPAAVIRSGRKLTTQPLGSGPFLLVDWPEPGRLRLRRREDGLIVELVAVQDPNVRVMKLLRGEIQMLQNDLSPELIDYLAARPSVRIEVLPGRNFSYLGFNLEDPITGDWRVRRAIALALDREALLRYLFRGRARAAEAIFAPEHWVGNAGLRPFPHDPAQARRLLASLDHGPDRPLALTMKTSSDPFRIRLATAIQAQLAEVGIQLQIRSYDWGTFFGDIKEGRFQVYGLSWVGINTPDIFRYAFHSASLPPAGANRGRYRDAQVDALIESAASAPSQEAQAALYARLQARLHQELPYVPLWYEPQVLARRPEVSGYRLTTDGSYDGLTQIRLGFSPAGR